MKEKEEVSKEGELAAYVIGAKTKLLKEPPNVKRRKSIRWMKTKGYDIEEWEEEGLSMKLMSPTQIHSNQIILQLHGGAYIESLNEDFLQKYRLMSKLYSKVNKDCRVLTINYRVAPEHPYPAALEDAKKAYFWLLEQGYRSNQIILVGDSAGGGLALALALFLRDQKKPLPKAIITLSAWTNLTAQTESVRTNFDIDPVFGLNENACDFMYHPAYADGKEEDPYVSPYFGDYTGFPPMLMQVGEREMLLNDTVDIARKARNQGVSVQATIYQGMMHVFQMAGSILPESEQAWKEIEDFLYQLNQEKEEKDEKR